MCNNKSHTNYKPLADRCRPETIDKVIGQSHLLGKNRPLRISVEKKCPHSMILWGPPGTGKTTLAEIIAHQSGMKFIKLSAVFSGVKDIRKAVDQAQLNCQDNTQTILFIDEIHRFNKSQQDAFLPYVENGTILLIGATTENPSFELNNALLSRVRVYVLKKLEDHELTQIIRNALEKMSNERLIDIIFAENLQQSLIASADGDARKVLLFLEILLDLADVIDGQCTITQAMIESVMTGTTRRFDKQGDIFYDQISALHKSVRGSAPDAALYWLVRMLDGGCDPIYIARRVVRMASEDIGNADPRALTLALNAWEIQERLGSPEGELAIAQAVIYLACAAKSNAVYNAFKVAKTLVRQTGSLEVPIHLRNAPTTLMKNLKHGEKYRYAHDEPNAYAAGENYMPAELKGQQFYHPVDRGLEIKIAEKLERLKKLDKNNNN
ncbi:MAG: replication-associated recombination protein A [Methylococcales bacterium]|jgi:putative ATPase|nr:replication-associated recombination protein A [Methylococcales bacterium]MBT7408487.1 replication-associated recombination protein A [Methylococcales bacterium]